MGNISEINVGPQNIQDIITPNTVFARTEIISHCTKKSYKWIME